MRFWLFPALCLLLYGRQLTVGYLADDFLYLRWLDQGLDELLRKVTVDSDPQMIRPLPALAWLLSWLPGGAVLQHGLSLLLHTVVATLLARRISAESTQENSSGPLAGLFWGALFLAVPLFGEPMIWLSSATDLWAAVFALVALELACPLRRETVPSSGRLLAASLVFGLALLSKETVLLLPVVAWAMDPRSAWHLSKGASRSAWHLSRHLSKSAWHPALALGFVAAIYFTGRVAMFGGFGGYLEDDGTSQALTFDAKTSMRNLGFQLPLRLLFPIIGDEGMPLAALVGLGLLSLMTMGGFVAASLKRHGLPKLPVLVSVAIALLAAVTPVLPVLSVDAHHGGGRLVYWPLVVAFWGLSRCLPLTRRHRPWAVLWLTFWCAATVYNNTAWSQAGQRLQATIHQLPHITESLPPGSHVLFDGYDSWRGAYLWRNALHAVLERHDLGHGHQWQLGSGADLEDADLEGYRFLSLDQQLRLVDRTACIASLRPAQAVETLQLAGQPNVWSVSSNPSASSVALQLVGDGGTDGVQGRIYWRRGSRARFGISASKTLRLGPGPSSTTVLLEPMPGDSPLEVWMDLAGSPASQLQLLQILTPETCQAPRIPSSAGP